MSGLGELLLPPNEREDAVFLGPTSEQTELKYRERVVNQLRPRLRALNLGGGLLLAGTALLLFLLHFETREGCCRYDVYTAFPVIEADGRLGPPAPHVVWRLPINILSAVVMVLGAVYHLAVAVPFAGAHERLLARNQNPARWFEYAFSVPILRVELAVLCGVGDAHLLWSLFGLTHAAVLLALLFERANGDRRNQGRRVTWPPVAMALVPQAFSWAVVLCYFARGVAHGGRPATVWTALIASMLMEMLATANVFGQWCIYNDWIKGEVAWVTLSFVYRQLFVWLAFGAKSK